MGRRLAHSPVPAGIVATRDTTPTVRTPWLPRDPGRCHGREDGVPLVLLHGGGSTIEVTFSRVLPLFAESRRVIAVEEQGHGRTSDRDAPMRFETSADDVARLLILPGGHGDYLGDAVMTQGSSPYPKLTAGLIEAFLDGD